MAHSDRARSRRARPRPEVVEHEVVVPADGTLWPEFEGLPVKRTLVFPASPAVERRQRRPALPSRALVLVALALLGSFVLPHLVGWRVLVW